MNFTLPARAPFSLLSVVQSHGWVQLAPFQKDDDSSGFRYVDHLPGGQVVEMHVRPAPTGGVSVTLDAAPDPAALEQLRARLNWMLGLDQNLTAFYALAAAEPKLAHVAANARGRVLRSPTLFEDVIKTILTTNTQWGGTKRMTAALVEQFGALLLSADGRRAFPTPAALAASDVETLRTQTRLGYRAPYVLDIAQRAAAGDLDLEQLKTSDLPTPELRKYLLSLKGIGPYAAANLLMLLGRYDHIPIDSWALACVSKEWHGGAPVTPADVEAAFARWEGYKGLAYWFWRWEDGVWTP